MLLRCFITSCPYNRLGHKMSFWQNSDLPKFCVLYTTTYKTAVLHSCTPQGGKRCTRLQHQSYGTAQHGTMSRNSCPPCRYPGHARHKAVCHPCPYRSISNGSLSPVPSGMFFVQIVPTTTHFVERSSKTNVCPFPVCLRVPQQQSCNCDVTGEPNLAATLSDRLH